VSFVARLRPTANGIEPLGFVSSKMCTMHCEVTQFYDTVIINKVRVIVLYCAMFLRGTSAAQG